MRRLILTLAATLAVAAPLASLDVAWAKDGHGRGNGGGEWQQQQQHGPRGGGERAPAERGDRGGGWRGEPRGGEPRGNGGGYGNAGGPGRWRDAPPRDEPPPAMAAPSPRRGGYLPPEAGRGAIQDSARYRLRAPPRGYTWVRIGNDFALVSESTGQVFDVVPGR